MMRLSAMLFILSAVPAMASSPDAWDEFRNDVEAACTALAPTEGETIIEVNPFGSESYGAALLITTLPDGGVDRYVCVFDKQAQTAELTAPFNPPQAVDETLAMPDGTVESESSVTTDAHLIKP